MFFMLQDNGRVPLSRLEDFADRISAARSDIREVCAHFSDYIFSDIGLDEFVKGFARFYKSNEVFNWMDYLMQPYKELEEFKHNEIIKTKRKIDSKKAISLLPVELHHLVYEKHFDEDIVKNLHLAHNYLQENKMLTVENLAKIMKNYYIRDPLAILLAKKCLSKTEDTSEAFITVFYLLTQESATEERNELLFSLYSKDDAIGL
eukprot:TRINITY_DN11838_c0_g2_i1.p1 TRINITY_DN11838_c0_g2~~TRINITY_DN11838_c0_g2_i1.p1  ORF type:complete len:205 (+),score=49.50 TRINITY_DN11838_c0_g2_i1:388-1002(+)